MLYDMLNCSRGTDCGTAVGTVTAAAVTGKPRLTVCFALV